MYLIIVIIITLHTITGFDCWFFHIQVQYPNHKYWY